MKGGKILEVVETIYEEEDCEFSSSVSISSLSPSPSPPLTPLHSRIEAWTLATRRQADVLIRVQGDCFQQHKDRLISRSSYLKHQLRAVSDFTLSPPLNITAETFRSVSEFCYSANVLITPSNVVALRVAAELLGMTETRDEEDENLRQLTETYFCGVVSLNQGYASMVLRSCLALLPESETTAFLVSRCLEAMSSAEDGYNDLSFLEDIIVLPTDDFQILVDSMSIRYNSHDVLYRIIDFYLKGNNMGKLTEQQKTYICNAIDCNKLSSIILLEAVQNPALPLRFLIRAMLVEQLNTRHAIVSATTNQPQRITCSRRDSYRDHSLGALIERDVVRRQASQLKATMEATSGRIQALEQELDDMKKLLNDHHQSDQKQIRYTSDSGRSASFHVLEDDANRRIKINERGSASSSSFRFSVREESRVGGSCSSGTTKNFGQRLISGLRNAFKGSNSASKKKVSMGD